MKAQFLSALLACAAALGAASPSVETPMSRPVFGPAGDPHYRLSIAAASNGSGYLLAWEDRSMEAWPQSSEITIRALDASGGPLTPASTRLGFNAGPSIAWNGNEYLVVWGRVYSRFGTMSELPSIEAMRVRADGTPIDSQPVVLAVESNAFVTSTHVAWNGSEYLVGWGYRAVLVSRDLHVDRQIDLGSVGGVQGIAASGSGFLVAGLNTTSDLRIATITASGIVGQPSALSSAVHGAALTSAAWGYELVWGDASGVHEASLDAAGHVLRNVDLFDGAEFISDLSVSEAGGGFLASWITESDPSHTRICTSRFGSGAPRVSCSERQMQFGATVAASASTALLAWIDRSTGIDDVRIDLTPFGGIPQALPDDRIVSEVAQQQTSPVTFRLSDGSSLVAWSEYNSAKRRTEVRLGGADRNGNALPDRAVLPSERDQFGPALSVADDGRILVVWAEGTIFEPALRGAVIVADKTTSLLELGAGYAPSIAYDGSDWLVVWQTKPWGYNGDVRTTLVTSFGQDLSKGGLPIAPNGSSQTSPDAVWTGRNFIVVWRESVSGSFPADRVEQAVIDRNGMPSAPIAVGQTPAAGLLSPSIAASGSRVLITWIADFQGAFPAQVRGVVFDNYGDDIQSTAGRPLSLTGKYGAVYARSRAGNSGFVVAVSALLAETLLFFVTPDGQLSSTLYFPFTRPDFAAGALPDLTLVYSRPVVRDEGLGPTSRVFVTTLNFARRRSVTVR